MMKIIASVDGAEQAFNITVQTPLLTKYFPNFSGMIMNDKSSPKGVSVKRTDSDTAIVTFPIPGQIMGSNADGQVSVSTEAAESVSDIISISRRYVIACIKYILKRTEFLPIYDFRGGDKPGEYNFEEMKKDVVAAAKSKRDFLIIDTYENYLKGTREMSYEFNQHWVDFGTSEYADVIYLVLSDKLEELRKKYKGKLVKTSWF